ncbi:MAG: hypothetical protein AAF413_00085 [Patescibacteria group bacterium]
MRYIKGFLLWVGTLTLAGSYTLFAVSFTANSTIGNQETVVGWLDESDTYQNAIDAIGSIDIETSEEGGEGVEIDEKVALRAAQQALDSSDVRAWSNSVISGVFAWLEGEADRPEFTINLGDTKTSFADALYNELLNEYENLPECTEEKVQEARRDPIGASCQSSLANYELAASQIRSDILNNDDFLGESVYTVDSLNREGEEPIYEQLDSLPALYGVSQKLPLIFIAIAAASSVVIVFASGNRSLGLRRLSGRLITSAVGGAVATGMFIVATMLILRSIGSNAEGEAANIILEPLASVIVKDLIKYAVIVTVTALLLAIGLRIISIKTRRENKSS